MEAPLRARTLRYKTMNNELIIKTITGKNKKKIFNAALDFILRCFLKWLWEQRGSGGSEFDSKVWPQVFVLTSFISV